MIVNTSAKAASALPLLEVPGKIKSPMPSFGRTGPRTLPCREKKCSSAYGGSGRESSV